MAVTLLVIVLSQGVKCRANSNVVDKIVARVNNKVITQSDVNAALKSPASNHLAKNPGEDRVHAVIDDLINQTIFDQEVEKQNIQITDEDLARSINTVVSQNRTTLDGFKDTLSKKGISFDEYRKKLKAQLQKDEFVKKTIYPRIRISDHDVEEYYNKHVDYYKGYDQIRFLEIFLTPDEVPTGTSLEPLAGKIEGDLKKGASFGEMAKKYSHGAFASSGGDSGILKISEMKSDLVNILLQLKLGIISDPLETDQGIFIFKVTELTGPHPRPMAEVADTIREQLGQERVNDELENFVQEARSHSFVEIK